MTVACRHCCSGAGSSRNTSPMRESDGALHHPLELADVPGQLYSTTPPPRLATAQPPGGPMPIEKGRGKPEDVGSPLAEGGHAEVHAGQAVIEVGPENASVDQLGQAPIGCRDDTDIDAMRSVAAHSLHRKILNGAEQLRLCGRGQVGHLVEKQRTSIGVLELAPPPANAGRGPLLDAEQLRLEQGLDDRGAVDGDERRLTPAAQLVDLSATSLCRRHSRLPGES